MNIRQTITLVIGSLAAACAQAGLLGQTISATGFNLSPATATIGAGPEFRGIGYTEDAYLSFDFSDTVLTLSFVLPPGVLGMSWIRFDPYIFGGFTTDIVDMYVESNQGFTGSLLTGFSFGGGQISIDFTDGGACCAPDTSLVYRIVTRASAVPEPTTAVLALIGLVPLMWSRSRCIGTSKPTRSRTAEDNS